MPASYFFYDLETTGFDARRARIMQYAGQRTDLNLHPIGDPVNILLRLSPDVLPDPDAIMITGITPQHTLADGISEAAFLSVFYEQVVQPDTVFLGFNTVRFDDEFMRYLHYRNFYDPYEWQWRDGCSRWDILDLVRMTRALRPEGITWPLTPEGKPTNRLELLATANGLGHGNAHDALNDVRATIAVAQLIKKHQPDLFTYLLNCRHKAIAKELILKGEPFVYTSGKYPSATLHTTAGVLLAPHEKQDAALIYDLRYDPEQFMDMSIAELVSAWKYTTDPQAVRLPIKTMKYNRCPAVAPLGVLKDNASQARIDLSIESVQKHWQRLRAVQPGLTQKIHQAVRQLDADRNESQSSQHTHSSSVDGQLYDSFIQKRDAPVMAALRAAKPADFAQFATKFTDKRLKELLPLYKARNYPTSLTPEERRAWDTYCQTTLFDGGNKSRIATYFQRIQALAAEQPSQNASFLLQELQLYGESLMPLGDDSDGAPE